MKDQFTLIAYKPSNDDYCKGCLMDSYSSNIITASMLTPDELVEQLAAVFKKNKDHDSHEDNYELRIYKNGKQVWNDSFEAEFTGSVESNLSMEDEDEIDRLEEENRLQIS
jgi:hypothetical protein